MRTGLIVTGDAGFIGSAVVRLAIARGYEVPNVDALTHAACVGNAERVARNPRYRFAQADIRDSAAMRRGLADFSPDAVMHLAPEGNVDRSRAPRPLRKRPGRICARTPAADVELSRASVEPERRGGGCSAAVGRTLLGAPFGIASALSERFVLLHAMVDGRALWRSGTRWPRAEAAGKELLRAKA